MSATRLWVSGLICCAVLGLTGGASQANPPVRGKSQRIVVYPGTNDTEQTLRQRGVSKIDRYGAYWLAEVNDTAQFEALQQSHRGRIKNGDYLNKVQLRETTIDVTEDAPAVPQAFRQRRGQGRSLWLVQFKGPVVPEWLAQLKSQPRVQILNYVPNNAYLISAGDDAEQRLQGLLAPEGPVQWIGEYHPLYKLPASLREATGMIDVRVAVLSEEGVTTLRRFAAGTPEAHPTAVRQILVTMKVNATDLPTIAQLPEVLWIQQFVPVKKHDEVQGLVLAGFTNNAGYPTLGASYLDFLLGGSLSGANFATDPFEYPVLDICDTGVDTPRPYGAPQFCRILSSFETFHPSFNTYLDALTLDVTTTAISNQPCCDPPFVINRKISIIGDGVTDTDGHGTRVASIALGFDIFPDEIVHCQIETFPSTTLSGTCVYCADDLRSNGTDPSGGSGCTVPPNATITETAVGVCASGANLLRATWTLVTTVCVLQQDSTSPPPPWYVSRRDFSGFQLGLGISPFGSFSVSRMEAAQENPEAVAQAVYLARGRLSNNSWGQALVKGVNDGGYDALAQSYDALTRDAVTTGLTNTPGPARNQEMLFIFAGGNENGAAPVAGGFGDVLVTPPATAKNVIAVGATNLRAGGDPTQLSVFSSFGPTRDGRFKPDLVAPGAGVAGAVSQGAYAHSDCGGCDFNNPNPIACANGFRTFPVISRLYNNQNTASPLFTLWGAVNSSPDGVSSYAAPAVSGGAQLLWWYFQNTLNQLPPSPAMLKGYLLNSARYLPITNPFSGAMDRLPSIGQGMGMMDLNRMFDGIPRVLRDETTPRAIDLPLAATNVIAQQAFFSRPGQSYELTGQVVDPTRPFRVTLTWTDPPGTPGNFKQLVNDLDLIVTINGQVYSGNDFETQYSRANTLRSDTINNVESVYLPPGTVGTWSVVVRATELNGIAVPNVSGGNNQDYALVVYNAGNASDSAPNPATNDTCQTAFSITNLPFTVNTSLTTNTYHNNHPSPGAGRGGVEAFWKIPHPTIGTTFSVNTSGSAFDTMLSVWRGECGALIEEVSNNDASNTTQSAVSFTAAGGVDYYIVVETHNGGAGGNLRLNVSASTSPIALSPTSLLFADQIAGTTSSVQTVTFLNGAAVPVQINTVTIQGADSTQFAVVAESCSGSLVPTNGTCEMSVVFVPTGAGPRSAQLVIQDSATGSPRIVPLSGTGLPSAPLVCLDSNHLFFDPQLVGSVSATQAVVVQNCGTAPLVITNAQLSGVASADFSITGIGCGPLPATLAAGESCTFNLTFIPTTNGNRNAVLSFNDNATDSPQTVLLTGKGCAVITVTPGTLPAPAAGVAYSQTLSANGGIAPFSFAVSLGGLPTGLTLDNSGVLAGTPTTLGQFTFTVTTTDATGCSGSQQYTVTVGCGALTVLPVELPDGLQLGAYTNNLTATGGIAPIGFAISAGSPPPGVTLAPSGLLAGSPTASGSFVFNVTATDANGCSGVRTYTIFVLPAQPILSVTPAEVNFLDQLVGTTSTVQQVTIKNDGTAPLVIGSVALTGGNTGDFVRAATTCLGSPIAPGATCTIDLFSAPTVSGLLNTTLRIFSNAGIGTNDVPVHGSGIAPVMALSATVLNFGTNAVNVTSPPVTLVVQNVGNAALTVNSVVIGGVNPGDFTIAANSCIGGPILPGQTCELELTFKTTTTLPRSAILTISSNATNTPRVVALNGTGLECPILTMAPVTLSNAVTGVAFSQTITVANGTPPYTFSISAGALPPGLTLGTDGVLAGIPTSAGSFTFTVLAQDAVGCSITRAYTLSVGCSFIGLTALPVTEAPVGVAYNQSLTATNGTAPYAFSVTGGALPPGITLSTLGALTGTPTATGGFNFTVQAQDASGCTGSRNYTLAISCPFIGLVPTSLTNMSVGVPFTRTLVATNGTSPYAFSLVSGTLPPGLTLNSTGVLAGTPSTAGAFVFTIQGLDANNCFGQQTYSVGVSCPTITLTPTTLSNRVAWAVFSQVISGTNGAAPYSFTLTAGALPAGVQLTSTGTLTGTPTEVGFFPITVQATDANQCMGSRDYIFSVSCPSASLLPATLPEARTGDLYFETLFVSGSPASQTFDLIAGALPLGLELSGSLIFGTPTTLGNSTFTIRATDPAGCIVTRTYTLAVTCPTIMFFSPGSPLPVAARGEPYSQPIVAFNAIDPITYTLISGSLPPGMTFSTAGILEGTPTLSGTYTFGVRATDVNGCTGSRSYSITVSCDAITVTPTTLPNPKLGTPYSQTVSALAPGGTVTFAKTEGNLPPGLTLESSGQISGTPTLLGTFTFKVSAINVASGCTGDRFYTLIVTCPTLALAPATLPIGEVGVAYTQALTPSGGAAPYVFTQTGGSLPFGLTLSTDGVISGTPLSGSSVFKVTITDANGCQSSTTYTLVLANNCPTVTVGPVSLPNPATGATYNQVLSASGGVAPHSFSIFSGALPPGLVLSTAGVFSGTATTTGAVTFTVAALDASGCAGFQTYSLQVACGTITVAPVTVVTGIVQVAYSQAITATGGTAPRTFAVTGGALPAGVGLSESGAMTGTPTEVGTFAVTVTATDVAGCTGSRLYSLVVVPTANLGLTKSASADPVAVDETLTYTIVVTNRGPSTATGVTVTDVLPADVTFVAASSGCGVVDGIVTCNLGNVASGASVTVNIAVTSAVSGTLTNTASVTSDVLDLDLGDNAAVILTTVSPVVEMTAMRQIVNANAGTATLKVTRRGNLNTPVAVEFGTSDGTGVAGVDYVATTGTLNFNPGSSQGSITIPVLPHTDKGNKTVKLSLHNPTGGATLGARSVSTIEIVNGGGPVSFPDSDGDQITVTLAGTGSLEVSLVGDGVGPIQQITVLNTGAKSSLNVKVKRGATGNGLVDIGTIVGTGSLKSINAKSANLLNGGIALDGALGKLTANAARQSVVGAVGGIGNVRLKEAIGALVSAGFTPTVANDPFAGGTFGAGAIKNVKIGTFQASTIAAAQIAKVQLTQVTIDNGGKSFGVLAQSPVGAVSVKNPAFKSNSAGPADQVLGDFHVKY